MLSSVVLRSEQTEMPRSAQGKVTVHWSSME